MAFTFVKEKKNSLWFFLFFIFHGQMCSSSMPAIFQLLSIQQFSLIPTLELVHTPQIKSTVPRGLSPMQTLVLLTSEL